MGSQETITTVENELGNLIRTERFAIFKVNKQSFAVPVSSVNRIIRAVIITPVPGSPGSVKGVINLHGDTIPVVDFRRKFGFPPKAIELKDKMIVLETSTVKIVFVADEVIDLTELTEKQDFPVEKVIPGMEKEISGLLLFDGEIILIYDIEKIFLEDAEKTIDLLSKKRAGKE